MKKITGLIILLAAIPLMSWSMTQGIKTAFDADSAIKNGETEELKIEKVVVIGPPSGESPPLQLKTALWFPQSHQILTIYWDGIRPSEGKDSYRIYKFDHEKAEWKGYFEESAAGGVLKPVFLAKDEIIIEKQFQRQFGGIAKANEYLSYKAGQGKQILNKGRKIESNVHITSVGQTYENKTIYLKRISVRGNESAGIFIRNLNTTREKILLSGSAERPAILPGGRRIVFYYRHKSKNILCFYGPTDNKYLMQTVNLNELSKRIPAGATEIKLVSVDKSGKELLFTFKDQEKVLNFGYFVTNKKVI